MNDRLKDLSDRLDEQRQDRADDRPAKQRAAAGGPQRRTRQRVAVDQVLSTGHDFRTAQQIHDELRHADAGVGLTTVYRTLQLMADSGEVDVIRNADGEMSYRRCSDGHHHHLVCRSCGRTVEISGPAVEKWANAIANEYGFRDVDHELEIFGTCADC
jgi:Fur family ferric uptake transcriptional regulator